ncbi:MAG: ATP-binding protein [Longimicrobiales bacterium]
MLRQSLRWRLPLFLCALVVLMLGTFLWATYRVVEDTLVRAGHERALTAADQIAGMLATSLRTRTAQDDRLRGDADLRAYLQDPTPAGREAARRVLTPLVEQPFRRVELWDAGGSLLLELATPGRPDSTADPVFFPAGSPPVREGVSPLQAAGELPYFDIVVEIRADTAPAAPRLGYVRRFGRVTTTPGGAVRRLVGNEAVIKVGTIGGPAWTDLSTIVAAPPIADTLAGATEPRTADDRRWVGSVAAIEGTPWVAWVGFPRSLIVAPAQPFIRRMMMLALLFVAASGALAALLGMRLARPLHALAHAAEEIAAGDYTRRVATARRDEIGRLSDAFNTMTDRVEHAYGELRKSHEQTHFALAAARIGVWESDLATGEMVCSDSMRIVHGLPPDALPTTRDAFLELVHADDRAAVRTALAGRPSDEAFDLEYRAIAPDGSVRWIEGKGRTQFDDGGQPRSVLGVSADVTDRRRLEAQLHQSQKMEAIGQLAGGVAHDFNNLLTAIVGHGNLVLGQLPEPNRLRGDVIEILKAGESAAGLTRQLLAFSRRQVTQPEVIDLNEVVTHTEKLLRRLIGEDIVFVTALAPRLDHVRVDRGHLEQVLVNLAVNARDAMPDGGRLTITTGNVDLDEAYTHEHLAVTPGPYVMLAVSDTGIGMDAETQAHIFEPFFTTKAPGKGTGLGLATVFGIVKQSGGHVYVYSEPGSGTTFKIYLPASAEKAAVPVRRSVPKAAGGTETVLVVEDNAPVRAIATRILEQIGYRVVTASSGEEALQLLDTDAARPDLVVSDVIMPGISGPDLCRQLAVRYPGLRVLFTSGYSGDALGRHGIEESGTLFIEKPYTPAALADMVREALGHTSEVRH